jgi:hypothetical protein
MLYRIGSERLSALVDEALKFADHAVHDVTHHHAGQ